MVAKPAQLWRQGAAAPAVTAEVAPRGGAEASAREAAASPTPNLEAGVFSFIDTMVIPFLTSLYGAVGYLGVFLAMTIEAKPILQTSNTAAQET